MQLTIEKYGIYRVELPVQDVTRKGENGKPIPVTGSELHGPHRVVVVSVAEDGQSAVVIKGVKTQ